MVRIREVRQGFWGGAFDGKRVGRVGDWTGLTLIVV